MKSLPVLALQSNNAAFGASPARSNRCKRLLLTQMMQTKAILEHENSL